MHSFVRRFHVIIDEVLLYLCRFSAYAGRRRQLYFSLLMMILGTVLFTDTYNAMLRSAPPLESPPVAVKGVSETQPKKESVTTSSTTNIPALTATAVPEQCRMGTVSTPSAPAISMSKPGVTAIVEEPKYYQVYGYSIEQIQRQIYSCSPVRTVNQVYAASTNYAMNWTYNFSIQNAVCSITDVAVGVRVSQVYPYWEPAPSNSSDVNHAWQRFSSNLRDHEDGHKHLAIQSAHEVYDLLKNMPPTECGDLIQSANSLANRTVADLKGANESYDLSTGHGVTQGAILTN